MGYAPVAWWYLTNPVPEIPATYPYQQVVARKHLHTSIYRKLDLVLQIISGNHTHLQQEHDLLCEWLRSCGHAIYIKYVATSRRYCVSSECLYLEWPTSVVLLSLRWKMKLFMFDYWKYFYPGQRNGTEYAVNRINLQLFVSLNAGNLWVCGRRRNRNAGNAIAWLRYISLPCSV